MRRRMLAGLLGGLILWLAFFYLVNRYLMEAQGLPVGPDLMPL